MYHVTRIFWAYLLAPFLSFKVLGKENIPPQGAFIIVAEHSSAHDPWIIVNALGSGLRPVRWLAGSGLYDRIIASKKFAKNSNKVKAFLVGFIVSFIVKYSLTIPVEREEDGEKRFSTLNKNAFKMIKTILSSHDGIIGIFPEGGIKRKGNIHTSFVGMAQRFNVPILPVQVKGKEVVFSKLIIPDKRLAGHERVEEAHRIMGRIYTKETKETF